jgi:DNA-binding CsgD family transcriptional regulator
LENQSKFIAPPTDEKIESEYIESFLDENMYNIRILTKEDWLGFKNSFEKVHPHFIEKIRIQYPTITEAEERMFVLIKLKMKTSEAAAILGISSDSVKKSKNRLKKKMNLSADDDLEIYINTF